MAMLNNQRPIFFDGEFRWYAQRFHLQTHQKTAVGQVATSASHDAPGRACHGIGWGRLSAGYQDDIPSFKLVMGCIWVYKKIEGVLRTSFCRMNVAINSMGYI